MTQFLIIRPSEQITEPVEHKELRDALVQADLNPDAVDHGVALRGVGIVVYEFGLFMPPAKQAYFVLGGRLYAGNAVLYGVDEMGETVDSPRGAPLIWLPTRVEVEKAIKLGLCPRPRMAVNDDTIWEWPQPAPAGVMR